jgi:hypothetical protein
MFGEHKENESKETQFWSKVKKKLYERKVFSFPYSKKNTFLFFIDKTCTVPKYKSLNFLSLPSNLRRSIGSISQLSSR